MLDFKDCFGFGACLFPFCLTSLSLLCVCCYRGVLDWTSRKKVALFCRSLLSCAFVGICAFVGLVCPVSVPQRMALPARESGVLKMDNKERSSVCMYVCVCVCVYCMFVYVFLVAVNGGVGLIIVFRLL